MFISHISIDLSVAYITYFLNVLLQVRYESRKKLAEKRPRVKGQFVRQVHNETQPANSSAS